MSTGAGKSTGGRRGGDARDVGRSGGDGKGGARGGRGGSNDGLPVIKGQNSCYCLYSMTIVWDYNSRGKCPGPTCKKILPRPAPTLPSGFMWCDECKLVCVSALHARCQMFGWLTPLGKKRHEAMERCRRNILAQQQKLNVEIDERFRQAEVEVERARQEELDMEIEADKTASQLELSTKGSGDD